MEVTAKTTHVVTPNEDRTMNVLRGVTRACIIVKIDWIHESLSQNKWLDTTFYQHNICNTVRVSVCATITNIVKLTYFSFPQVSERATLGNKIYKNSTFANRGPFFLYQTGIDNSKKIGYLKEIITLCGGAITENHSEALIVVSDQLVPVRNPKQSVVVTTFIFDCAMKGALLEVSRYAPKKV